MKGLYDAFPDNRTLSRGYLTKPNNYWQKRNQTVR
jgi:hypothetical protein